MFILTSKMSAVLLQVQRFFLSAISCSGYFILTIWYKMSVQPQASLLDGQWSVNFMFRHLLETKQVRPGHCDSITGKKTV